MPFGCAKRNAIVWESRSQDPKVTFVEREVDMIEAEKIVNLDFRRLTCRPGVRGSDPAQIALRRADRVIAGVIRKG